MFCLTVSLASLIYFQFVFVCYTTFETFRWGKLNPMYNTNCLQLMSAVWQEADNVHAFSPAISVFSTCMCCMLTSILSAH